MGEKYFIITIDTEGDNQWDPEKLPSTENAKYLPRFQELCEKYRFKPVWLTNYEMAKDPFYAEYMNACLRRESCEVGMHLHAWHNPPAYELREVTDQRSYLFEYPEHIMDEKIKVITNVLEDTFQRKMISHRSGRWATNETYFKLLKKFGYKADCSVTPYVDWTRNVGATGKPGSDYSQAPLRPYYIYEDILEVPVTIRPMHIFCTDRITSPRSLAREVKWAIKGRNEWLRPTKDSSAQAMKHLIDCAEKESDYLMFMLHSSEMMPGGSPAFPDHRSIERLYDCLEEIFSGIYDKGYIGTTLSEYNVHFNDCR